jgi:hypothetical protein
MIGLIPFVANDYLLLSLDVVVIIVSLFIKRERNDIKIFIFGFLIMIVSEYIFTSTRVEVFIRDSLFGLMPIWLPFLWGYGFIAIKRLLEILNY